MASEDLYQDIIDDKESRPYPEKGYIPLIQISPKAGILILGQAPGLQAQTAMKAFQDTSGKRLRAWMGVDEETFHSEKISVLPMDFFCPGRGKSGDLSPRKGFAGKRHPQYLRLMPDIRLVLSIGNDAIGHYLRGKTKENLITTVRNC